MAAVELSSVTSEDWAEVVAGEHAPWGGGEQLTWGDKTRHVGVRDDAGRLIALAGACTAELQVEGHPPDAAVGIGGVFVNAAHRGEGLAREVVSAILEVAAGMGPRWAMLFCDADRMGLYEKFGFAEITAPVWADQPTGRIEMPQRRMWLALGSGAEWPDGRVDVLGLPF